MNFVRNNFANLLTLGNLFSGSIGAIQLVQGNYEITALCIIISLVLDFFDGFVARALKANSNLGIQLDSLADMVSFGLVPGLAMYHLLHLQLQSVAGEFTSWIKYFGLLITLGSCLRLAIFNLDEDQKFYFKGLNTPSNTIMIFGLLYAYRETGAFTFIAENLWALVGLTVLSAWLLISPIRMIAIKFKSKELKDNISKIALLVGAIIILAIFRLAGIPLVILYYILISVVFRKDLK